MTTETTTVVDPLAGNFDENAGGSQVDFLNASKITSGEYYFILGIGDPSTNRDQSVKTYAGNDALRAQECVLFDSNSTYVTKWLYTCSNDDPGHVLGLDKKPSDFGGYWNFPSVVWTIPVLWNVSLTDDEEELWDGKSGTPTLLQMTEAQWRNIVEQCGAVKRKYSNVTNKVFKLIRNTDKSTAPADKYRWTLYDPETSNTDEAIAEYVGGEFSFAKLMEDTKKGIVEKFFYGVGPEGVENVWAHLEEKTGLTRTQIIANPLYNQTSDMVGGQVDEIDLSLDT